MGIFKLIYALYKMKLLSPVALYRLAAALYRSGINVMTLLYFAERTYGGRIALVDDKEVLDYSQLLLCSEKLSIVLKERYGIKKGNRTGLVCKNSASLVKSVFALSMIGTDIYLLNAEMGSNKFHKLINSCDFDLIIYDAELAGMIDESGYAGQRILSFHESLTAVNNIIGTYESEKSGIMRCSMGKLVLMTGGTTGDFKEAAHKPSLFNYLNPFMNMLTRLKLLNYGTVYIATPIYHGYGLAVLFLFIALGKKVVISRGFNSDKACSLIREHNVEVTTVVPLMVHKMLNSNVEDLKSLKCIASGGAELSPRLVEEVQEKLGDVLYNLYGTSESGLNMIATPEDLRYSPNTIGRKIRGLGLRVLDINRRELGEGKIGQLCMRNSWSMRSRRRLWIETGDLGYRDKKGYYFLCGRTDDMVVSAGENVYPVEVEKLLTSHPEVEDAAVIGVSDENFGQRLRAFVLPVKGSDITEEGILEWLRLRAARFQIPREIILLDNMPYTPLGKLDKKQLKQRGNEKTFD